MSVTERPRALPGPLTAQPAPPSRLYSFTDWQTSNPTAPPPGDRMDADYDNTNTTLSQTLSWAATSLNTDGTLKAGTVGSSQMVSGLFDDIAQDIIDEVQPLVDSAQGFASAAGASSITAQAAATAADHSNTAAGGAATTATAAANTAIAARNTAQTYATTAQTAATNADNSDNHATGAAALAQDYADVTQAWAEHMPDTIPPNILAVMGITGDHWSSRWWAHQAALNAGLSTSTVTLSDAPPASPVCGQLWFDTSSPQLYVYYCDPNSSEWVIAAGNGAGGTGVSGSSPFFYIKDFGAKSDGVTDDSAAVNAAVNAAIAAGGGLILLSAGRTVLASPIAATIPATVAITIEGMGPDVSELYVSNATDGLNFTLSYIASPRSWAGIHLRGFSVTRGPTSPVVANTGICIAKTADALYQGTSSLRDLLVQGSSGFAETNGWNIGILLSSVGGITIDNVCILGATPVATSDRGDKLLSIVGGPGPAHPYVASVNIANCYMQGGSCGIGINEYVQGVFINNTTVIAQYDSIRWALMASGSPLDRTHGGEELAVTNCTLNAWHRGIWMSFVNQSQISNTTILRTASGTLAWAGIEVNQSGFNSIIGNNVTGANAADGTGAFGETGILISSCDPGPNTIVGNTCGNIYGYGVWFKGSSTFNVAAGNNFTTAGGTGGGVHGGILEDSPGANTIAGNQWNGLDIPLSRTTVAGHVFVQSTQAQSHQVIYQNVAANNPNRWFAGLIGTSAISDPDNGSNTGSDYQVIASHDDGTIAAPAALTIKRSSLVATLAVAPTIAALPVNAANDAAAAAALVPLNGLYRNGSVLMIRAT